MPKYRLEGMCQCPSRLGSFALDRSRATNIGNSSFAHRLTRPQITVLTLNADTQATNRLAFAGVAHDGSQQCFLSARPRVASTPGYVSISLFSTHGRRDPSASFSNGGASRRQKPKILSCFAQRRAGCEVMYVSHTSLSFVFCFNVQASCFSHRSTTLLVFRLFLRHQSSFRPSISIPHQPTPTSPFPHTASRFGTFHPIIFACFVCFFADIKFALGTSVNWVKTGFSVVNASLR